VSSARDEETLRAIRTEIEDRYGRVPATVENLFEYARLRLLAEEIGVISIDRTPDGVAIKLNEKARVAPDRLMELIRESPGAAFTPSGVLKIALNEEEVDLVLETVRRVLLQIRAND
jgi:transcription-repair coupling factor (superfamily II helicase)